MTYERGGGGGGGRIGNIDGWPDTQERVLLSGQEDFSRITETIKYELEN